MTVNELLNSMGENLGAELYLKVTHPDGTISCHDLKFVEDQGLAVLVEAVPE